MNKHTSSWNRTQIEWLAMLAPCFLLLLLFNYIPMLGNIIAFKDFRLDLGILASPWSGFENFRRLFSGADFMQALRNTVVISVLRLGIGFWAPIILALLLNEIRVRWFKRTIQTVTYLPYFFSWVILGGIFLMVFSLRGPANMIVSLFGLDPITFLTDDRWFLALLIGTAIWQGVGYGAVIYLAALSGIPVQLYEAAAVDGAGRWQQMLKITLPCLVPTMIVLFILRVGQILSAGFDQVYNLYNPMVYDVADIIDTYVLRRLQTMDFGLATAAGLFKSVIGLTLVVGTNMIVRRMSNNERGVW
jgi:putative aldouronate transport system permease protein